MEPLRSHRFLPLLGVLLATVLVVLLAMELRTVRADYAALQAQERYLAPGMYIPQLELDLLEGGRALIGSAPAGTRQLLFVYNTTCGFCLATLPAWQDLTRMAPRYPVEVYGLAVDPADITRRYAAEHRLAFRSALVGDQRSIALLRATLVPQTLVIEYDGRVLHSRSGVLTEAAMDSILNVIRRPTRAAAGVP